MHRVRLSSLWLRFAFVPLPQFATDTVNLPHAATGRTALWEAVARANFEIAALLLEWGASPNAGHPLSGPPLLHAAAFGESRLLTLLLQNGAEVDAADAKRFTALHYACFCSHLDAAQQLLRAGASVDSLTITGETALGLATDPEVRPRLGRAASVEPRLSGCLTEGLTVMTALQVECDKQALTTAETHQEICSRSIPSPAVKRARRRPIRVESGALSPKVQTVHKAR